MSGMASKAIKKQSQNVNVYVYICRKGKSNHYKKHSQIQSDQMNFTQERGLKPS